MNCPNCGKALPENISAGIKFCPLCGERLFEEDKYHVIEVQCAGRRDGSETVMMVFVDDREMYEVRPGESISFGVSSGVHNLKFRQNVRSKNVTLIIRSDFVIRANFNSITGLIETNVMMGGKAQEGYTRKELEEKNLTMPVMVSTDGKKSFDIMLGDDEPKYEIRCTSGLREGVLKIYSERCEFTPENQLKPEVTKYKDVTAAQKKMGSLVLQCDGNVHIVYSIPKDSYNEVMAFLNNRISKVKSREADSQ